MAKIVCVKSVLLVLPEVAQQYGIAAEAPVFLSPYIDGPQRCYSARRCRVTYTPLVYQTGHTTRGQHWHRYDGGIYFYVANSTNPLATPAWYTGWLAFVEPVGHTVITGDGFGRAEAVAVRQIMAWCMGHGLMDYRHLDEAPIADTLGHTVAAGALVAHPQARGIPPPLLPVCAPVDGDVDYVPFTFQVRDGIVFFSSLSPQIAELLEELKERRNLAPW